MSSAASTIRKHDDLPGATGLEALGLTWLAEPMADGGAHVVPVTAGPGWIDEPRLAAGTVDSEFRFLGPLFPCFPAGLPQGAAEQRSSLCSAGLGQEEGDWAVQVRERSPARGTRASAGAARCGGRREAGTEAGSVASAPSAAVGRQGAAERPRR